MTKQLWESFLVQSGQYLSYDGSSTGFGLSVRNGTEHNVEITVHALIPDRPSAIEAYQKWDLFP